MATDKPNKTSMDAWTQAWTDYCKLKNMEKNNYVYSGVLKSWINPITGEQIKKKEKVLDEKGWRK